MLLAMLANRRRSTDVRWAHMRHISLLLLAALTACGGKPSAPTTPASDDVAVAWTVVDLAEPPSEGSPDNVRVSITVGGAAHELGTARGDNIEGKQGAKACDVSTPSPTKTVLGCNAGLAYTRFVATLTGGELVVERHEGVSAEGVPQEDAVSGEPKRIPAAGATLSVTPYAPAAK